MDLTIDMICSYFLLFFPPPNYHTRHYWAKSWQEAMREEHPTYTHRISGAGDLRLFPPLGHSLSQELLPGTLCPGRHPLALTHPCSHFQG